MKKLFPVYHSNDQMEDYHPGCTWGILHVLDYHHWHHNVKKMLPHRSHKQRKHAKRNRSPNAILGFCDAAEAQELLDAEASHFIANEQTTETSSIQKRSLKARIKALVAEEIRSDYNKRSSSPAQPRLGRTLSIHHLESADYDFKKPSTGWKNPIIFLPRKATLGATKLHHPARLTANEWKRFEMCTAENLIGYLECQKPSQNDTFPQEKCNEAQGTSFNQALKKANQLMQNGSRREVKEYADVLELYQVNKELFQEFQEKADVGKTTSFETPQDSKRNTRFTKSGSFPVSDLSYSYTTNFKPSKLEHKQTEIWSFPRGEKIRGGLQTPVIADDSESRLFNRETNCSSAEIYEMGDDSKDRLSSSNDASDSFCGLGKGISRHRRTTSLNESLHRYARLFDGSFGMNINLDKSKSLKLANEYEISSGGNAPISFKRNRSLPHVDPSWLLLNEESGDSRTSSEDNILKKENPVEIVVMESKMKSSDLDSKEENDHFDNVIRRSDCGAEAEHFGSITSGTNDGDNDYMDGKRNGIDEVIVEPNNYSENQEIAFKEIDYNKHQEPSPAVSILESCHQEEVKSYSKFSASKVVEYNNNYSNEMESPLNSLDSLDTELLSQPCSTTYAKNLEIPNKILKNYSRTKLLTDIDSDLNYVREVLECAGFDKNGFNMAWYSSDQPLSPLTFDEVEDSRWPHGAECSEENISVLCRHQLLFDLVNEVIIQIYEKSFTYYPKELSSGCRVHTMHGKFHDEEVLKTISKSLVLKPELDDPVTRDYGQDDGWMNLQMESECVALELEDLIFDELLEELICS